jgi:hypothetical protein
VENKEVYTHLTDIMRDPVFDLIRNKITILKDHAYSSLLSGTKEQFDYNKATYKAYTEVLRILDSPKNVVASAVQILGSNSEQT